ncbi:MAG TPA: DUF3037 domain-containing protein [Terriglobales bacterium]|nr:DUF3037 domain-containing protein [Terriglobales bacterium]
MKERQQFKAWLLKYTPNVATETFVVIGVLAENETGTFAKTQFLDNWYPVIAMDSEVDVEYLDGLKGEIERAWVNLRERRRLLKLMEDSFSNTIQISPALAVTATDPHREFDNLARLNLQPSR